MHCRAYLLIEQEYDKILKNPEWGIEVMPSESNIFCWYATICGLGGTIWENGRFHITIRFDENYDDKIPEIKFNTIPFHPNIDPLNGDPCIDLYPAEKRGSSHRVSIIGLLVNLQALLSNPVLENAVNTEAANLLRTAPHIYMQLVKNCVTESAKLIETLKGQDLEKASKENSKVQYFSPKKPTSSTESYARKPNQVSFDNYHKSWLEIASSQPVSTIKLVQFDGHIHKCESPYHQHMVSPAPSAVSKNVALDTEQKLSKMRQKKLQRITAMKQLYLNNADAEGIGSTAPVSSRTDVVDGGKSAELWEKEADELVAWTATLEDDLV